MKAVTPAASRGVKSAKDGPVLERRDEAIGAAITLLARHGAHGLTHRAIDRHLHWPIGSTSNYFRRRNDLLVAVAERVIERDLVDLVQMETDLASTQFVDLDLLAQRMGELLEHWLSPAHRERSLARAEILFETTRNAELRATAKAHSAVRSQWLEHVFAKLGAPDPTAAYKQFLPMILSMHVGLLVMNDIPSTAGLQALIRSWAIICSQQNGQPRKMPALAAVRARKHHAG